MKTIYLAGGCFWGVQHYYSLMKGIIKTKAGYANSDMENPSYENVCQKLSTAAECVEINYDENVISLKEILHRYRLIIDPYSVNKQGGDIGMQYRTGIYYIDELDLNDINDFMHELANEDDSRKIQIEVMPLENFYDAENYHQDYLFKNPNGYCHVSPELMKRFAGK